MDAELNGNETKYYDFAGRRIAMRTEVGAIEANCTDSVDNDADGTVNDGCARYILADHLGSTSTIVDRNGATATVRYWPYGATRSTTGTVGTDKLFTGQQQEPGDPALGLYNYGARFYSTTLGRFASVDPVVGSAGDPQSWNGYSYVRNNPLRYTDPTGMYFEEPGDSSPAAQRGEFCGRECRGLRVFPSSLPSLDRPGVRSPRADITPSDIAPRPSYNRRAMRSRLPSLQRTGRG